MQLAEPTRSGKNLVKGWRLMGQTLLAQGEVSEAKVWLKRAVTLTCELGNPLQRWQTAIALGDLYRYCQLSQPALTAYRDALTTIEQTAVQLTQPLAIAIQLFPLVKSLRTVLCCPELDK